MASLVLTGDTSGQVTIAAPAVAGTTTLTLPATTGTVLVDTTVGVCRAWVNFNGTGTVAIRASFNVTSITDNGTGNYTINFTTAMTDVNYSAVGSTKYNASAEGQNLRFGASTYASDITTTTLKVQSLNAGSAALTDSEMISVAIFR
jgi:hypothetical protein